MWRLYNNQNAIIRDNYWVIYFMFLLLYLLPELFFSKQIEKTSVAEVLTSIVIVYFIYKVFVYLNSKMQIPNKVKNENASVAGTDAQKTARPLARRYMYSSYEY